MSAALECFVTGHGFRPDAGCTSAVAVCIMMLELLWRKRRNQNVEAHLGPINCTGLQRSEKMGSVRMDSPAICTRRLACPSHVTCSPFSASKHEIQAPLLSKCSSHKQKVSSRGQHTWRASHKFSVKLMQRKCCPKVCLTRISVLQQPWTPGET